MTPYIDLVPKDVEENIRWRLHWRELAIRDVGLQDAFRQAAMQDVLFWFNAFCWCFEPRSIVKVKPFVTWPHQDPAILVMDGSIDESASAEEPVDVVVDKSRGQGATWMYLMILTRRWLKDDLFSAGLVTRNESLVDSLRDPDTLMWKIAWMLHRLPFWMLPPGFVFDRHRSLSDHSLFNPDKQSTIVGYSATGDVARGGRKSVFAMDEFATFDAGSDYAALNSTQHVTRCRWLVSTYRGDTGAYYDAAKKEGNSRKVILDWKENPTQNKRLYTMVKGILVPADGVVFAGAELVKLRRQHELLGRRGYRIEGKTRNAWYNSECLRPGVTPRSIAQELDRDPHGSVSKVFSMKILNEAKASYARSPLVRGRFVFDSETAEPVEPYVVPSESGELSAWFRPDLRGFPPFGSYFIGVDIGGGTGGGYTANSVASVVNEMTGEQVVEWVSNTTEPRRFAYVCVALCRWFYGALLIPEANFGGAFFLALDEIGYHNVWQRETEISGLKQFTKKVGFWMNDDNTKLALFEGLQAAICSGSYIPRSESMLTECGEYEWKNGRIIHIGSTKTDDEGAKGKSHSDRVIAAALSVYARGDMRGEDSDDIELSVENVPEGSMASRLRAHDSENRGSGDPWEVAGLDIFRKNSPTGDRERDSWL